MLNFFIARTLRPRNFFFKDPLATIPMLILSPLNTIDLRLTLIIMNISSPTGF